MQVSKCFCDATQILINPGKERGKCCFCNIRSSDLVLFPIKKKFTLGEFINDSPFICPYCLQMYNTQSLRYSHWILTKKTWKKLSSKEVLEIFLKTPPPFALFTSKTFKRQGWIRLLQNNYTINSTFLIWIYETELLMMEKKTILEIISFLKPLILIKCPKKMILNGMINIEKILENIPHFSIEEWLDHWNKYNQLKEWQWIVRFIN